jgi:hypothetical protein
MICLNKFRKNYLLAKQSAEKAPRPSFKLAAALLIYG